MYFVNNYLDDNKSSEKYLKLYMLSLQKLNENVLYINVQTIVLADCMKQQKIKLPKKGDWLYFFKTLSKIEIAFLHFEIPYTF